MESLDVAELKLLEAASNLKLDPNFLHSPFGVRILVRDGISVAAMRTRGSSEHLFVDYQEWSAVNFNGIGIEYVIDRGSSTR